MQIHSHHDASRGPPSVRRLAAFLAGLALAALTAVASADAGDIEVVSVRGDVRITAAGTEHAAKAGTTLDLPSTVSTGRDGATDLRQGETTIGVGPDTKLEFPAPALPDAPVDRIAQPLGNAFYNVGPRGDRRLRVETPYLVAVIKGTQFNVAVEPDSATISLHEGSLEILAPDIGASVQLKAGEIAVRHRGDDAIRVIPMRAVGTAASTTRDPGASASADGDARDAVVLGSGGGIHADGGLVTPIGPVDGKVTLDTEIDATGPAGVQVGIDAGVDAGVVDVDTGVDAGVDLGVGTVDVGVDTGVDAGVAGVDVGVDAGVDAGVDLGAGTVDGGVDLGVDAGPIDADVGVDVGADLTGADAGVDVGLDVLGAGIDIGLGGDTLIDVDTTPETEDTGGLLRGLLPRLGL